MVVGSVQLAGVRESVACARSRVRGWLGTGHPSLDDVLLAVSELVTNALHHSAAGPRDLIGLTVVAAGPMVYVEVRDPGSAFSAPHVRREPEAEGGRGLLIVSGIAERWGVREYGRGLGRSVWCAIRAAPPCGDRAVR